MKRRWILLFPLLTLKRGTRRIRRTIGCLSLLLGWLCPPTSFAQTVQLPRTGQTKCYDTAGTSRPYNLLDCVHSGSFRFVMAFALSCIGLYALIRLLPPFVTAPINEHTASTLGLVLNSLDIPVSTANDMVSGAGLAFRIIPECTPIFTSGLLLCFVAFYPAAFRDKAMALLMGIPALYLGNLARLVAISIISRYDWRLFEILHVYLGQVFTLFLVLLACVAWLHWLHQKESTRRIPLKAAGFLARFAVISGCLFLVWIKVHHWYIRFLDQIILFGFSLFNHHVPLARQTAYYYETFSTVVFVSLVLGAGSIPLKMKVKGLAGGLVILFVTHLIHRINNVLLAYFHISAMVPIDLTLLVVGQYLVPVLSLIYLLGIQRHHIPDASANP